MTYRTNLMTERVLLRTAPAWVMGMGMGRGAMFEDCTGTYSLTGAQDGC